jgi:hypothetical protein
MMQLLKSIVEKLLSYNDFNKHLYLSCLLELNLWLKAVGGNKRL